MSSTNGELHGSRNNQNETIKEPKEQRRSSDELIKIVYEKLSGEFKSTRNLAFVVIAGLILAYYFINENIKNRQELVQTKLDTFSFKIDEVLQQNVLYTKNMKAFNNNVCGSCHLTPNMMLPKTTLSLDEFMGYVRGTNRFVNNSIMPKYKESDISDKQLQEIWKVVY